MKIVKKTIKEPGIEELFQIAPATSEDRSNYFSKMEERVTTTVSKDQLETLYHVDGLFFRAINDYVDKVVGPGFYLEGKEDLKQVSREWFDNIKLKRLMEEGVKDIFVSGAGNSWFELGYSEDGKDIPSVRILNPKLMDYIRDKSTTNNVKLDDYNDPVGFKQSRGTYRDETEWTRDAIISNGNKVWTSDGEQDGRDRVAHFKLFGLGESYLGNSPSESVYKQAIIRLNLEDNAGTAIHQSGGIVAYVGTENAMIPTKPETIQKIVSDLQNVDFQSVFGFPKGTTLDRFPTPDMKNRLELLVYFAAMQNIGLGIPTTRYLLPSGRAGADASATKTMDIDFEQRIIAIQDRLAEQIREKLLFRYLKAKGLVTKYSEVPTINFRIHTSSILSEAINMISRLGRRDMIRRDPQLEKYIREELNLPTKYLDREIAQWEADPTMIPSTPIRDKNLDIAKSQPQQPQQEEQKPEEKKEQKPSKDKDEEEDEDN